MERTNISRRPHIVTFLQPEEAKTLKFRMEEDGFAFSDAPSAIFAAKSFNVNVAYYQSGKLLVQGQEIDMFLDRYLKTLVAAKYREPVIGTDESGKGDYFGPLVTAAVLCDWKSAEKFLELSVQDSKNLSDNSIMVTAAKVRTIAPHAVVTINPQRYNELYEKLRNVNRILAWAHARAIENLLTKSQAGVVITDKFGHEALVRNALLEKGRKVKLLQRVHGEEELPVAAASVVARALFLIGLKRLSRQFGIELPKGASAQVEETARQLVKKHTKAALSQVAKLHFRTTARVIRGAGE
jgi:ribonuclease HIII